MTKSLFSIGLFAVTVVAVASLCVGLFSNQAEYLTEPSHRGLQNIPEDQSHLPRYNQASIELLLTKMSSMGSMLLVFDGQSFRAYGVGKKRNLSFRYARAIPLMVNALRTNSPERFAPGQPPFQLVFTTGDFLNSDCVNPGVPCPYTKDFPPIVSYATMHRDESVFPTAKAFPNPHYLVCLCGWKLLGAHTCDWQEVDKTIQWEDLIPTLMWRGSDFQEFITNYDQYKKTNDGWIRTEFTSTKLAAMSDIEIVDKLLGHWMDLSPRWRAAALTLKTKLSGAAPPLWIDTMFTGFHNEKLHEAFKERGIPVAEEQEMDGKTMSKYRYQIDFGGGGGTTWQGTLTKLQMPGVLFHHETPTKDWYYDMMKPWKHFIPVGTGLADLWLRYTWAQEHPDEAKAISEEASRLAETLLSEDYMNTLYDDLYVSYLKKVVEAFQSEEGKTWDDLLNRYRNAGITFHEISDCSGIKCRTEWRQGKFVDIF